MSHMIKVKFEEIIYSNAYYMGIIENGIPERFGICLFTNGNAYFGKKVNLNIRRI